MNTTQFTTVQIRTANAAARRAGYGKATEIKINPDISEPRVVRHTRFGFRKFTTGEYVPNAYRAKFGWKNTFYQNAETVVEIPA